MRPVGRGRWMRPPWDVWAQVLRGVTKALVGCGCVAVAGVRGGPAPGRCLQGWGGTGEAAGLAQAEAGQRTARNRPGAERSFEGLWWVH